MIILPAVGGADREGCMSQSHVRHGVGAVRPYIYGDLATARFLVDALGAVELERLSSGRGFHIEAQVGDGVVVLESSDVWTPEQPRSSIYVYVPDVDTAYAKALALGATSLQAPVDKPYRERACGVNDPFGNTWYLSTYRG